MKLITAKWSITDYHRMISAGIIQGKQVELINGEIVEMSPEGELHAYSSDEAGEYLIYLLGGGAKVIALRAGNGQRATGNRREKGLFYKAFGTFPIVTICKYTSATCYRSGKPITLLDNNSEPEPDIAIVQRLGKVYQDHHPYPENIFWLIEHWVIN